VLSRPALYRAAIATADSALRHLPKFAVYNRWNTWTEGREMPPAPKETFHTWYARTHPPAASDKDTRTHPPATGGKGTPNESA
jgi:L-lactate dehydrogenase complex protein LldF